MLRVFLIKSMKEVKERYHMGKERKDGRRDGYFCFYPSQFDLLLLMRIYLGN